jgi:hypothetical protein
MGDPGPLWRPRLLLLWVVPLLLGLRPGGADAAWVSLGGALGSRVEIRVLASSPERIVLEAKIPGFEADPVEIMGKTYYSVSLPGEGRLLDRGLPELPRIARSLIIPDGARMEMRIIESESVDLAGYRVIPSKGDLLRTVEPSSIPYWFDPAYGADGWWPAEVSRTGPPYILRDHRGMVVEIFPFQVRGGDGSLRVVRRLRLEVVARGSDPRNALARAKQTDRVVPAFEEIYRRHFLNWSAGRFAVVPETGRMLVITADAFHDAMLPFVEWKNQKGIPTRMVDVSTIGNSEAQIDAAIDEAYGTEGIAFVLLVGDAEQVATAHAAGGASDPTYALTAGDDSYPDLLIGRFSAESPPDLETQIARTIAYERDPAAGADWYHRGTGIASAEGPGDNGELDFEHAELIRSNLLGYTYTQVDPIYDPGATAAAVSAALNEGRSLVNYTGHGSSIGWGTSGFTSADVGALVNDSMLPFILSVGCVNGAFEGATCFAETWLRARHDGVPTGAIAAYMSSVNQLWNPPMCAQDAFVDFLVQDQMHSIGGLCFNGSCRMIDVYGASGASTFRTWHLFGDPSVLLRTASPVAMSVGHPDSLLVGDSECSVTVEGVAGAVCALYGSGTLYGAATSDSTGSAAIQMAEPPVGPATLTLTVTAYNRIPFIAPIEVVPITGPLLTLTRVAVLDGQTGDNDSLLGAGETADLSLFLWNRGVEPADSVIATLTGDDPYLRIDVAEASYGRILPDSTVASPRPHRVSVVGGTPDRTVIPFVLNVHSVQKSWTMAFDLEVVAPLLGEGSLLIDDTAPGGNGNGSAEPGESFYLQLRIVNGGHATARNLVGILTCRDPNVQIPDDRGECLIAPVGGEGLLSSYQVAILPGCPTPRTLPFHIFLAGDAGVTADLDFPIQVGDWTDDAEVDRGWIVGLPDDTATGGGWVRADPIGTAFDGQPAQPEDDHTPINTAIRCFVTGNGIPGGAAGESDVDGGRTTLLSPEFGLGGATSTTLNYWRWYTNNLAGGSDREDSWTVEVTANGNDWIPIEHTNASANQWRHRTFNLEEYIDLSNTVRIRFVVDDVGVESLVEAAVDDLTLSVLRSPVTGIPLAPDPGRAGIVGLAPNPIHSRGRILIRLERDAPVHLGLYDPAGRLVRSLSSGPAGAGDHTIWLDAEAIPAGVYFVRLAAPGILRARQVIILH